MERISGANYGTYGKEANYFMLMLFYHKYFFLMHVTHMRNLRIERYAYEYYKICGWTSDAKSA